MVLLFTGLYFLSVAQRTIVSGVVRDALTNLPIQFTGVFFKGGNGVNTDSLGGTRFRPIKVSARLLCRISVINPPSKI